MIKLPSCEGGEVVEDDGVVVFGFALYERMRIQEQPPARYARRPPSQEGSLGYLFIICFASILSVACGTARKRALSMSLPVTRQIP